MKPGTLLKVTGETKNGYNLGEGDFINVWSNWSGSDHSRVSMLFEGDMFVLLDLDRKKGGFAKVLVAKDGQIRFLYQLKGKVELGWIEEVKGSKC